MAESVDRSFVQMEMPAYNPVDRNDVQDRLASERVDSKPNVASKAASAQKIRGHKSVKEITKPVKASNTLSAKSTAGKTSKPSVIGAAKVSKIKASRDKSPIKKKSTVTKEKASIKSLKETGLKKPIQTKKKTAVSKDKKPKKSSKVIALKKLSPTVKKAAASKGMKPKSSKEAGPKKANAKPSAKAVKK